MTNAEALQRALELVDARVAEVFHDSAAALVARGATAEEVADHLDQCAEDFKTIRPRLVAELAAFIDRDGETLQ
ncbi:hypothetical protein [Propylenella binzhouense]|uniref:Uncharacterized protein n=1 Tax=Propylenella binzhouense TaxID=2555902 RepID=A0A964T2N5_9HYPH|nr:hypothetical protein [Propylenella binzhouense]MYZ47326.1 hypothetical protein [Propylenella binzhouense]